MTLLTLLVHLTQMGSLLSWIFNVNDVERWTITPLYRMDERLMVSVRKDQVDHAEHFASPCQACTRPCGTGPRYMPLKQHACSLAASYDMSMIVIATAQNCVKHVPDHTSISSVHSTTVARVFKRESDAGIASMIVRVEM
ncbi:hypothetical protein PLICRDRAFT_43995 [Plicaturopsis crispa FD-325 SS-3]|nr:hypothetical protein PLICRDRAFT_43995 [Plicaturopsis crispa FD-325 SS-3]